MSYKNEEYAQSAALAAVTPPDRELDSSVVNGGRSHMSPEQQVMAREMSQPKKLNDVLKDEFGFDPEEDKALSEEALVIINEHGKGLRLGLKQWAIVQRLVEHGIVSGRAGS